MKLNQETSSVLLGEAVGTPETFKISASKEAFKILSSGLYNDKKLAIIRELCCNAYDAHIAAGKKDAPFDLHLPTAWEPYFSVKDSGVGLSHDEVLSLYTTYFSTNKSESNDYVGALGLGSKSPFCYTEGFSVTSRFNGVTRIYAAFINERGTPTIRLESEEQTPNEPNGLEVRFPTDQGDYWEWENKARIALEFFEPKPNLNVDLVSNKVEYKSRNERWGLRKNEDTHHTRGLRAIQGMVQYAVGNIDESRMTTEQKLAADLPLDLFFPIGELSVAASRESLSNDERTIGNILKVLSTVAKDYLKDAKQQVMNCKTAWEARLLIFNLVNQSGGLGGIINKALNKGEFDGVYINFTFSKDSPKINQLDYQDIEFTKFARKGWGGRNRQSYKTKIGYSLETLKNSQLLGSKQYTLEFDINSKVMVLINDLGFGYEKYIHYYLEQKSWDENGRSEIYFISKVSKDISENYVVRMGKKIVESLGNPPTTLLSELRDKYQAEMKATRKAESAYEKFDAWAFVPGGYMQRQRDGYEVKGWTAAWSKVTSPFPTEDKYYVLLKNLSPQFAGDDFFGYAENFRDFFLGVVRSEMFPGIGEKTRLYGLGEASPLRKKAGWVEFTSYVFTELKKMMTPDLELQLSLQVHPFDEQIDRAGTLKTIAQKKLLDADSPMREFCDQLQAARKLDKKVIKELNIVIQQAQKLQLYEPKNMINFNQLWQQVIKKYPVISMLEFGYPYTYKEDPIIEYIKLIDKQTNEQRQQKLVEGQAIDVYSIIEEKENAIN